MQYFQEWVYVERIKRNAQEAMFKKVLLEVASDIFKAMEKGKKGNGKR